MDTPVSNGYRVYTILHVGGETMKNALTPTKRRLDRLQPQRAHIPASLQDLITRWIVIKNGASQAIGSELTRSLLVANMNRLLLRRTNPGLAERF